ncbi:flagellar protein FlaG [Brevibacillus nitrificans]|uniref:flagellar protein FlaG n=1 Tax=Brevibacillus nitrificans TaxID=651560 RepID=UPI00260E7936|nr:flagellar protein FlaG [Brevibacillus nitrificans]MED1791098.1 flagellar protein FlaG [Brevibacillus nitrificans]
MDRIDGSGRVNPYQSEYKNSGGVQLPGTVKEEADLNRNPDKQQELPAVDKDQKDLFDGSTYLQFSVHKDLPSIMIKVFDKKTGDLIREVPPEKILDMVSNMVKRTGLIFDEKR